LYEVADVVSGREARICARNASESDLSLVERRMGFYKKYLSDRFYRNKRNVRKVDITIKYELRMCD